MTGKLQGLHFDIQSKEGDINIQSVYGQQLKATTESGTLSVENVHSLESQLET